MSQVSFVFMEPKGQSAKTRLSLVDEWRARIAELIAPADRERFSVVESTLQDLKPPHSHFDCVVSPANSYGIMDGGVDYYLSKAFSPPGDIMALTRTAQVAIKERYFGMAPPATCTLASLPPTLRQNPQFPNCRVLAISPTMRVPADVHEYRDLVYNTMWSLLAELEHWNESAAPEDRIGKVAMTGLATGTGNIPKDLCAWQMVLAIKHFLDARSEQGRERWARPDFPGWDDVVPSAMEVEDMPPRTSSGGCDVA